MTKKRSNENKPGHRLPVAKLLPHDVVLKSSDVTVEVRKLNEIAELLWLPESLENHERNARIIRALEMYWRRA